MINETEPSLGQSRQIAIVERGERGVCCCKEFSSSLPQFSDRAKWPKPVRVSASTESPKLIYCFHHRQIGVLATI